MEPRIQYAQTSDGVNIAFATYGEGDPLVLAFNPVGSHVQLEWQQPVYRASISSLAAGRTTIRFDHVGVGLSDRDVDDVSLGARVRDIEAVVEHLKLETFELLALENVGHAVITYTARHPERVSRLVLLNCFARGVDVAQTARGEALAGMEGDWELLTDTVGTNSFGLNSEDGRRFGEFLGEGEQGTTPVERAEAGAFRTILFSDVEGSTALTQRLGDARARELLRGHERIVREALKAHGGSEVKTMGDGFMASFTSATKALECAIAMQRAFAERNEGSLRSKGSPSTSSGRTVGEESGRAEVIRVRIGLNAGEPIAEEDPDGRTDLFGMAVILAARIAAKAEGGEILTSDTVRGLVAGKRFLFSDRGDTVLRGSEDPVRLYEVSWREEG